MIAKFAYLLRIYLQQIKMVHRAMVVSEPIPPSSAEDLHFSWETIHHIWFSKNGKNYNLYKYGSLLVAGASKRAREGEASTLTAYFLFYSWQDFIFIHQIICHNWRYWWLGISHTVDQYEFPDNYWSFLFFFSVLNSRFPIAIQFPIAIPKKQPTYFFSFNRWQCSRSRGSRSPVNVSGWRQDTRGFIGRRTRPMASDVHAEEGGRPPAQSHVGWEVGQR